MALEVGQAAGLGALLDAASRNGMSDRETAALLASSYVESSWNPRAIGDAGSSFGLFQQHVGGAGGSTVASAKRYLSPALSASEGAARFKAAGVKSGAGAAASQRPYDQAGYAVKVDRIMGEILAGTFAPLNRLRGSAGNGMGSSSSDRPAGKRGRVTGKTAGLNAGLLDALALLAGELGKTIDVISGKRSRAEQEALYQKFLNGTGNLAAKPGTSNHESGNAADAYIGGTALASYPGAAAAAGRYGLTFPVGGEPWHVELGAGGATGGAVSGSSSSSADDSGAGLATVGWKPDTGSIVGGAVKVGVLVVGLALAAALVYAGITRLTGTEGIAGAVVGAVK